MKTFHKLWAVALLVAFTAVTVAEKDSAIAHEDFINSTRWVYGYTDDSCESRAILFWSLEALLDFDGETDSWVEIWNFGSYIHADDPDW